MIYVYNEIRPERFIKLKKHDVDLVVNVSTGTIKPTYTSGNKFFYFTDEEIKDLINKHDKKVLEDYEKTVLENLSLKNEIERLERKLEVLRNKK